MTRIFLYVMSLAGLLASAQALATIGPVKPSPASQNVALGQATSVTLVWTVVRNNGAPGVCGNTVSSPRGEFRLGDTNVATAINPLAFSQTQSCTGGGPTTVFTFTESFLVPADVIFRSLKTGFQGLNYARNFTDGINNNTQAAFLIVTSSAAAGFGLTRMALAFDNGAPVRVLGPREPLYSAAEINFSGSGLLQGTWEIAGPTSTSGQPFFRPLALVRQAVVGGNKETLKSPLLPTDSSGLYLVRLRITDPVPGFEVPTIRYFVGTGLPGEQVPIVPIGLVTPPNQTLLAPDTLFSWEPVRGARAYQLEIYLKPRTPGDMLPNLGEANAPPPALPRSPAVTGMLVADKQTRTALSGGARTHLQSGQFYLWRVLAIGVDGGIVGESAVRELRMP